MRMQISAPAAESLALNSVGDSYSRSEYDIMSVRRTFVVQSKIKVQSCGKGRIHMEVAA